MAKKKRQRISYGLSPTWAGELHCGMADEQQFCLWPARPEDTDSGSTD
jgi:hypothetical protein